MNHQQVPVKASFKWRTFKGSEETRFGDDWTTFIRSLDSTILHRKLSSTNDLMTYQEEELDFQPIYPVRYNPIKDEEEDDDGYFYHACYADIQIPRVKRHMIFPSQKKKKFTDNLLSLNHNKRLYLTLINSPESLDQIHIPSTHPDFSVTISYHVVNRDTNPVLKVVQLYMHPMGQSYTVMIDQTCLLKNLKKLPWTPFGRLLTDPNITRICWNARSIESAIQHQLGLSLGKCIDLSFILPLPRYSHRTTTLSQSIHYHLHLWQDKNQFDDLRSMMDQFNDWNCNSLPLPIIKYCAIEGWAVYSLYLKAVTLAWFI